MLATDQIILVITRHIVRALTITRGLCALQLWKISPRLTNHLEFYKELAKTTIQRGLLELFSHTGRPFI